MWVFGGFGNESHPTDLFEFDFETQLWQRLQTSFLGKRGFGRGPSGRSRASWMKYTTSQGALREKIYLFGGWDRHTHNSELWELDVATRNWKRIDTDFSTGLAQHRLSVHDGTLYVVGGFMCKNDQPVNHLYAYRLKQRGVCA
jgi:N-acetylneuraminic acid mutarotase